MNLLFEFGCEPRDRTSSRLWTVFAPGVVASIDDHPAGGFFQILSERWRGRAGEVPDGQVRVVFTVRPTGFKTR